METEKLKPGDCVMLKDIRNQVMAVPIVYRVERISGVRVYLDILCPPPAGYTAMRSQNYCDIGTVLLKADQAWRLETLRDIMWIHEATYREALKHAERERSKAFKQLTNVPDIEYMAVQKAKRATP